MQRAPSTTRKIKDVGVQPIVSLHRLAILQVEVKVLAALRVGRLRMVLAANGVLAQATSPRTPAARCGKQLVEIQLSNVQPSIREVHCAVVDAQRRLRAAAGDVKLHVPRAGPIPTLTSEKRKSEDFFGGGIGSRYGTRNSSILSPWM